MFQLYDKKAYELLKKCSDAKDMTEWNKFREETNNSKINLRFANLINFYLKNANLKNVDFRFASLHDANMLCADLQNAILGFYREYYILNIVYMLFLILLLVV